MVDIIWGAPEHEIVAIGKVEPYSWSNDYGEITGLIPRDNCGELVAKPYLRVVGGKHVCIPCSGYER